MNIPDFIDYEELRNEITCGPIYLKLWISEDFADCEIPEEILPDFLERLQKIIQLMFVDKDLDEFTILDEKHLLTLIQAHSIVLTRYELEDYNCFYEVLSLVEYSVNRYDVSEGSERDQANIFSAVFIVNSLKIVHLALDLKENEGHLRAF